VEDGEHIDILRHNVLSFLLREARRDA